MPPPEPAIVGSRPSTALRAMQARRGPSPQTEGQGADPPYPKGGCPASIAARLAQPVFYEEEVNARVPPVLVGLHLRDGCTRAP